jgi:hypothetical protein
MGCRLLNLEAVYLGYLKTGIPLIAFDGEKCTQPITGDDIGIYILIPKLAKLFNLSLSSAINLFFLVLLFVPLIIGVIAFFLLYKNWLQRFVSLMGLLLLTRFAYAIGDVYLASSAAVICIIPWCLYMYQQKNLWAHLFVVVSGIIAGFCHYVRAYSGVAPLIFVLVLVFSKKNCSIWMKFVTVPLLLLGFSINSFYFKHEFNRSAKYAKEQLRLPHVIYDKHVFWHQMYIGLGLLNMKNHEDIRYDDSVASTKVKSLDENVLYCSNEYEKTLREEFFRLIFEQKTFLILTLFAKLGILFYFLIKFANVGLIAAIVCRKSIVIDLAFIGALFFNSLFCLAAIPLHEYALGFISCAALWGIVSINHVLASEAVYNFKEKFRNTKLYYLFG